MRPRATRFDSAGRCTLCRGGWLCGQCSEANAKRDRERVELMRRTVAGQDRAEIVRVCCELELESDEGGTREEKAKRIITARGGRK